MLNGFLFQVMSLILHMTLTVHFCVKQLRKRERGANLCVYYKSYDMPRNKSFLSHFNMEYCYQIPLAYLIAVLY